MIEKINTLTGTFQHDINIIKEKVNEIIDILNEKEKDVVKASIAKDQFPKGGINATNSGS